MPGDFPDFRFTPGEKFFVTDEMKQCFDENGFIFVRGLLTPTELTKLGKCLKEGGILDHAYQRGGVDQPVKMVLWNHPGEDYTGMIGRMERVVDTADALLGGEVYHYHTKIIFKEAKTGGSFAWHQDYGYWYQNGILYPDLLSVFIAMDDTDLENGCLRVLKGSHKMGRVDHARVGGQAGADMDRVNEANKIFKEINVILKAGDAIFFHCNLLHTSAANNSDRRRYAMIPCYNRVTNDPYIDHHARVTKLHKVPDSVLETCDNFTNLKGKWFMDPATDKTTGGEEKIEVKD